MHPSILGKIIIVDFEDSFTYNIANILFPHERRIMVISHDVFFSETIHELKNSLEKHAVILGPGPGHPESFRPYFVDVCALLEDPKIYLMGICLGHQVMALAHGLEINYSETQMHGQSVEIEFEGQMRTVQRYNSLAVFNKEGKEEHTRVYPQGISYQFHPESVGTEDNILFFYPIFKFLT